MNIAVFGANGGTGRLLVRQAVEAGHVVTAVTRHPEAFPIEHENLRVLEGDVYDIAAVERAIGGADAVISTLGVPYGRKPITIYSEGTGNIVQAMRSRGVRRLLCVSSSATDPATRFHDTGGGFVFERVLKPIITKTLGKQTYADMLRMEKLVMASGLDWTIARPSGLFDTDAVTAYETAEGFLPLRYTSRADLADALLRAADGDSNADANDDSNADTNADANGGWVGKTLAVGTVDPQPRVLDLMLNEAFQRG